MLEVYVSDVLFGLPSRLFMTNGGPNDLDGCAEGYTSYNLSAKDVGLPSGDEVIDCGLGQNAAEQQDIGSEPSVNAIVAAFKKASHRPDYVIQFGTDTACERYVVNGQLVGDPTIKINDSGCARITASTSQ
jgi:hypothetical protein